MSLSPGPQVPRSPMRPRPRPFLHAAIVAAVAAVSVGLNTRLDEPPRFDGAGYAMLARSLGTGQGYREVQHPDRPPHTHYPPGYPVALAALWRLTGPSMAGTHGLSVAATLAATLLAWRWFRAIYPAGIALLLGVALAVNWTWGRGGGAIQSEPLYLLLGQLAVLRSARVGNGPRPHAGGQVGPGLLLGVVLGLGVLTRHVGGCLAAAVLLDLLIRGRRATVVAAALASILVISPWAAWLATARRATQAGLLAHGGPDADRALFYVRRLPDQIIGPFVEKATVFGHSRLAAAGATGWAVVAAGVILWGWVRALRSPRRRLAALVPLATLALLLAWPFTEAGRFLIPLVPFILIGALEGLAAVAGSLGAWHPRRWAAGMVLILSIPYAVYAIAADRAGAQRRTHANFDAACDWIARHGSTPGPLLTTEPVEAYWQTGRHALAPADDPAALDRQIDHYAIAYLIVDDDRYARAPANPLSRHVAGRPRRVREVWGRGGGRPVAVYAVVR